MPQYSDRDVDQIVSFFRKPIKAASVKSANDLKIPPNDVLFSYLLAGYPLSAKTLAALCKSSAIIDWLAEHEIEEPDQQKPKLLHCLSEHDGIDEIAASIRFASGWLAIPYNDESLLVAKTQPDTYIFPSQREVPYFRLSQEKAANVSILTGGFANVETGEIYVRNNSITMINALFLLQRGHKALERYRPIMKDFPKFIPAMIIAHELCEMGAFKEGRTDASVLAEVETNARARELIEREGIYPRHFDLYHHLRAASTVRMKNVSQIVIESLDLKPSLCLK